MWSVCGWTDQPDDLPKHEWHDPECTKPFIHKYCHSFQIVIYFFMQCRVPALTPWRVWYSICRTRWFLSYGICLDCGSSHRSFRQLEFSGRGTSVICGAYILTVQNESDDALLVKYTVNSHLLACRYIKSIKVMKKKWHNIIQSNLSFKKVCGIICIHVGGCDAEDDAMCHRKCADRIQINDKKWQIIRTHTDKIKMKKKKINVCKNASNTLINPVEAVRRQSGWSGGSED